MNSNNAFGEKVCHSIKKIMSLIFLDTESTKRLQQRPCLVYTLPLTLRASSKWEIPYTPRGNIIGGNDSSEMMSEMNPPDYNNNETEFTHEDAMALNCFPHY